MSEASPPTLAPEEKSALSDVLDELIPPRPDEELPGAGGLGLVARVEDAMRRQPELRPAISQGLASLRDLLGGRGARELAALPGEERIAVLNELAVAQPAFLPGLIFHTYTGYYQDARVLEALGLEARPPHPQGYELEPGDLSLLDAVRSRPGLYRKC